MDTPRIDTATSADELLSALASVQRQHRATALGVCGLRILREAADLCGIDSADMGKRTCITAILGNF
jgi:hypothetical protein